MGRELLFYSAWPLGYHNVEAEHKVRAFAAAGYEPVYVAGIGLRNPRLRTLAKAADRARRGMGSRVADAPVRTAALMVVPPRQAPGVRAVNRAWVARRLRRAVGADAVAWIRWPTPEVVGALGHLRPAAVVYECVDAYHHTPGVTGRWAARHDAAERALVAAADAVVVPGGHLAERFSRRAARVEVVPHGVDLSRFRLAGETPGGPPVLGFVGTLDYRLDVPVLRHIARERPGWRLRLVGPVQEGFEAAALAGLPNVSVEPAVAFERVPDVLAELDVCLMPYADTPVFRAMTPVKHAEILAVGRPAVARPSPALEPDGDLLYLAETPEAFVAQAERALAEDGPELRRRRRERAAGRELEATTGRLVALLTQLGAPPQGGASGRR